MCYLCQGALVLSAVPGLNAMSGQLLYNRERLGVDEIGRLSLEQACDLAPEISEEQMVSNQYSAADRLRT